MSGGVRVSSPRFVGRLEELARLDSVLDAARRGQPGLALVSGDAGMGKTRLVDELGERAAAQGVLVLSGRCVDVADHVLPYGPLVEILRDLVRSQGVGRVLELAGPTGDELARLAPAMSVGGTLPPPTRSSTTRMYQALTSLIEGLSGARCVLLVVEDLHWADRSTRDLLALLCRSLRGQVMLALTLRSDEIPSGDPLHRFAAELERAGAVRIALAGLDRTEQAKQIAAICGVPPTRSVVDRVYGRAEGNPLFAEELLAAGEDAEVPEGVRDLLLTRIRSLPDDAVEVARIASLAGRRSSYGLLAAVSGLPDARLDAALRAAVDGHVLVADPSEDAFAFRHALLRDAIRTTVLPGQGERLHARLAETLTQRPQLGAEDGFGIATRIAHHWHLAAEPARTLSASLAAATAAEEALAWPSAVAHYDRAISLFDRVEGPGPFLDRPRYQILWNAAEAAHLAAQPQRAAELIRAAIAAVDLDDAVSIDLELHRAYLHERLGRYLWMAADGVGALAAYERAVELVPGDEPTCWQAAIYSGYGQMLMLLGRFTESVGWCERAIAITGLVGDARSTEGHARNNLGVDLAYLGDVDGGIAHLEAARAIAEEEFDDVDDIARAIVNLHCVLYDAGRLEEAADVALEGIDVVDRLGLARRKGVWCRCSAAEALLRLGRIQEAADLLEQATALEPAGIDAVRTSTLLGQLHDLLGDRERARASMEEALASSSAVLDGQILGPLYAALVHHRSVDDPWEALALADTASSRLGEGEEAAFCVPLYAAAVRAAATAAIQARHAGDDAAASLAVGAADRWLAMARDATHADPAGKPAPQRWLAATVAERSRAAGRADAALWAAAAGGWTSLPDPHWTAYCLLRAAEAHLSDGDRDAAAAALNRAGTIAEGLGAVGLLDEVRDLARRARIRLTSSEEDAGTGTWGLTGREREVLALVAEGLTDRQVGERLFISHRTVERHVSNILGKTGASTRTEASAMWWAREDLNLHPLAGTRT